MVGSGVVGFLMLGSHGDQAMLPRRPFNHRSGPASVGPLNPRQKRERRTLREETNERLRE
jgi:hypothetical protein